MEKEIYTLDRIEEGIAAVINSDNATLYISASRLPENSKSGDCFTFEKGCFFFDPEETEKRRKEIKNLLDEIITKK
jgi:hypothetical protein